jgi:NitT/TauT family transport system substrate-binding protein
MMKRREFLSSGAVMLITAGTAALSGSPATAAEQVSLRLDWVNSGYHAIWYYGIDQGIFQKNEIDLNVLQGNGSAVTAQTVGNGSVMFGTADTAPVMGFISQGMPIKIVGGYLRQSALAIIFPSDKGWKRFKDMGNAKIGFSTGGASAQILPQLIKKVGLEGKVQLISMQPAAKMTSLLTGSVDGIDSFGFLGVAILEGKGLKVSTLSYANEGVNIPSLCLITSDQMIDSKPALVKKMVSAMEETIDASRKDPNAAINSLMKRSPTLDRGVALRTLELSFDLLDPAWAKGKPLAWMSPEIIAKAQDILLTFNGVKKKMPVDDYFTNKFV